METSSLSSTIVNSGGFRIEIRPDELAVTADKKAFGSPKKSAIRLFIRYLIFGFFGLYTLFFLVPKFIDFNSTGKITFMAFIIIVFCIGWLSGSTNIRCTRENLEVIRVRLGRANQTTLYAKDRVKDICFGVVSPVISKYPVCGIIFTVAGKKIKTLDGLKVVEAQKILAELQRLGYSVVQDVGMPMAVEMELERRNFLP
ncbi:MAG: hypothetical protein WB424_03915 [Terracidiphilus sp.]